MAEKSGLSKSTIGRSFLGGGRPRQRPRRVLANKAYSSRAIRDWLRRHHIRATIR